MERFRHRVTTTGKPKYDLDINQSLIPESFKRFREKRIKKLRRRYERLQLTNSQR